MLIMTRKQGESIILDDDVEVVVVAVEGGQVRLGFNAPRHVRIHRKEVYMRIQDANRDSAVSGKQALPSIDLTGKKPEKPA